jgi:hypothetical protein
MMMTAFNVVVVVVCQVTQSLRESVLQGLLLLFIYNMYIQYVYIILLSYLLSINTIFFCL